MSLRSPFAVTTTFSLALHLGVLFAIAAPCLDASGEKGASVLVVSFGAIELPAVTVEPLRESRFFDPEEVPERAEIAEPVPDVSERPEDNVEALELPEELFKTAAPAVIKKIELPEDAAVKLYRNDRRPPANETPGAPELTRGQVADVKARFYTEIAARIQKAKRYPRAARRRVIEGTVRIELVISAQGNVALLRLTRSSGSAILDKEAIALIRRAGPYPPIPEELAVTEIKLAVPIEYYLKQ